MGVDAGLVPFASDNIAAPWYRAGCAVIPIKGDGTKSPLLPWKHYQTELPVENVVRYWFEELSAANPGMGVAVICGSVSGNLEMLELEGRAYNQDSLDSILAACDTHGVRELWDRLVSQGYTEETPSGGLHLLYRINDHPVPRNTKIASRYATPEEYTEQEQGIASRQPGWKATRVLAETRGEGGYVIVAPSPGTCHPSGLPWRALTGSPDGILTISWDERESLHLAIRNAINEIRTDIAVSEMPRPPKPTPVAGVLSPADDFEQQSSWEDDWFTSQGWQIHHREGAETFWTRPGKSLGDGHSATTGYTADGDRLYIWSTSTDLPSEQPLSKFFVYAHYRFNGDLSMCARVLRNEGYGTSLIQPLVYQEFDLEPREAADPQQPPRPILPHELGSREEQEKPFGGFIFTDIGYARRIYDRYRETIRWNTTEKRWYIWHPGTAAWEGDDTGIVERIAERIAEDTYMEVSRAFTAARGTPQEKAIQILFRQSQQALCQTRLAAAVTRFRNQEGISVDATHFDNDQDLVNLQNGILNLNTREVMPHDSKHMMTLTFGAGYDPDATCPRFQRFMEEVIPDIETRTYIQRALGYSLTGRPNERVMFMLHGPSGTGKSVLTSVMTGLFGGYGTTAPATTFRLKKTETTVDVHQLKGKRFVATSEMPEGAQLDEELIKRITGGDTMVSRSLYESFHHWKARCVIWIATNFLPRLSSDDNAIWRRARTIPMKTEFGPHANTEIKGLSDLLLQERDGILNWLLDGLDSYQASKGLAEPASVIDDVANYRTDMDSVASWFREAVSDGIFQMEPGATTPIQQLYQSYTAHCNEAGLSPLGRPRFSKRLLGTAPYMDCRRIGGQVTWVGIRSQMGPQ